MLLVPSSTPTVKDFRKGQLTSHDQRPWTSRCKLLRPRRSFMHGHNVAHHDLESQNILRALAESGSAFRQEHYYSVILVDFGPTQRRIQSSGEETLMAGASRYKAPEMLEVREFQLKAADVSSSCYEILTGLPFEEYQHEGLSFHARGLLDHLILRGVPQALKKLIYLCVDSNPAQRPTIIQSHRDEVLRVQV